MLPTTPPPVRARHRRATARLAAPLALTLVLWGCSGDTTAPPATGPSASPAGLSALTATDRAALAREVRLLAGQRHIVPLQRPRPVRPALVLLGQALAFDKALSGNRDIACMTCHLPSLATGDARSLSIGQGGAGLGPARVHPQDAFIARNAPPAFNLHELTSLFWDGRVGLDGEHLLTGAGHRITPAMQRVFEFGALSAQPMFPVLSRAEMRGAAGAAGNELAAIDDAQPQQIWRGIMRRLGAVPEYRRLFEAAYPGTRFDAMTFAHASNAIAGFLTARFTFDGSPWDRFLAGDDAALDDVQLRGARDFMAARCSVCHNGPAFTDNAFHNVAVAQIGPGAGDGPGGTDDFGRMRVTGDPHDRYAFRTPALRNVELTAPYGHDGAFPDLRAFVAHYSESEAKLRAFDASALEPLLRGTLRPTADAIMQTRDTLLNGVVFTEEQIDEVTAFMRALTDPAARHLESAAPARVPSGLPVDR